MKTGVRSIWAAVLLLLGVSLAAACQSEPASRYHSTLGNKKAVVYLIRHAEKQKGDNPELTEAGVERAQRLAEYLSAEPIVEVWSTDFKRTPATSKPIADTHGLEIELYEPNHTYRMADRARSKEGVVVIVGHSNTIPKIASAFRNEGEEDSDFSEADYESLYWVEISKDGYAQVYLSDYASLEKRVTE